MADSNETRIMRSVYLDRRTDAILRQIAFQANVTKSALIRAAIAAKVAEWEADPSAALRDANARDGGPT